MLHLITRKDTKSVVLPWTRSRPVAANASTCTTQTNKSDRNPCPGARFGPASPAIEQQQTYALERTATAIGLVYFLNG